MNMTVSIPKTIIFLIVLGLSIHNSVRLGLPVDIAVFFIWGVTDFVSKLYDAAASYWSGG